MVMVSVVSVVHDLTVLCSTRDMRKSVVKSRINSSGAQRLVFILLFVFAKDNIVSEFQSVKCSSSR